MATYRSKNSSRNRISNNRNSSSGKISSSTAKRIQSQINQAASAIGVKLNKNRDGSYSTTETGGGLIGARRGYRPTTPQNETINSSSLAQTSPINLPTPPEDKNYAGTIFGNNAGLASLLSPFGYSLNESGQFVAPAPQPMADGSQQTDTASAGRLGNLIQTLGLMPQKGSVYDDPEYRRQQQLVDKSRRQVNDYTANLNSIVAKSQAESLALEGQGRGITESIIGGQQAQIAREAAIQALPVQAQIAAAQGNLDMAERQLNQVYQIKSEQLTNEFEYKTNQYNAIKDFLTKEEERKLAQIDLAESRTYNEAQKNISEQDEWSKYALANGRPDLITSIQALNPKSPTFRTDLARIQTKLGTTGGDRALTLDEAAKYGVPFGTKLSDLTGQVPGGGTGANTVVKKRLDEDFAAVSSARQTIEAVLSKIGKTPDNVQESDLSKLSNTDAESIGKALFLMQNPASSKVGDFGDAIKANSVFGIAGQYVRNKVTGKKYLKKEIYGAIQSANDIYKQRLTTYQNSGGGIVAPDGSGDIIIIED